MSQSEPPDRPPGGAEPKANTLTDETAPNAGWTADAPAPRPGRFRLLSRLIIPGIIVAILVGGFLLRDRISGKAADLKPGDCFDDTVGSSGSEVQDVQHHPCSEPHLFEVVEVVKFPSSSDAAFPGQTGFQSFVIDKCSAAFVSYIGIAEAQSSLTYLAYTPVEDGWKKGDRDITCFLGALDGTKVAGSMKNAKR